MLPAAGKVVVGGVGADEGDSPTGAVVVGGAGAVEGDSPTGTEGELPTAGLVWLEADVTWLDT